MLSRRDLLKSAACGFGIAPGEAREITLFKQNSDQGVGFMALAKLAHDKARAKGIGVEI